MFLNSSLKGINELIMGYVKKSPVAYYSPPMTGKTILVIQESMYLATQMQRNVLYIDTEANPVFFNLWQDTFRKRFNVPKNIQVIYKDLRKIDEILKYHGFNVDIKYTDKGKAELIFKGEMESQFSKEVKQHNIGVVVYDSMTNPLNISFPGGRTNFPSRADAINLWFNAIHGAAIDHDLVILTTHHRTVDPSNQFAVPRIKGGDTIVYNFKCQLYMEALQAAPYRQIREISLVRPWIKEEAWKKKCYVKLSDNGFEDITEEQMKELYRDYKEGKKRKKKEGEEDADSD